MLSRHFPNPALSWKEDAVRNLKDNCGWAVKVSTDLKEVAPPTREELRLLRVFDPLRHYLR